MSSRQAPSRYAVPPQIQSAPLREMLVASKRVREWDNSQTNLFMSADLDPAMTLHSAGALALLSRPCVSIVGTREATSHGRARSSRLARELVRSGAVIVSGLAKGIDTAAHLSAIESGGRTIAVIGTPVSEASPVENGPLQETIWREHLLVSQFAFGSQVHPSNFPQRNRVMAALSDATVIVEADDNSGFLCIKQ